MAAATILPITPNAISITPNSIGGFKTCTKTLSKLLFSRSHYINPQNASGLGRLRLSSPFLQLHTSIMITRNSSRKNSSRIGGESVMEIEHMIENEPSGTAPPSKGIGHLVNKSSKWAVAAIVAAIVIWRHDAQVIWAATGSILNAGCSRLLKIFFNQQRPASALHLKADPGMPSSHAQSLGYLTVYAVLALIGWQGLNLLTAAAGLSILICGAYLVWLRVSEGLHTYAQVLVGELLGSIAAIVWFWLWKAFMLQAFTSFFWVRITLLVCSLLAILGFLCFAIQAWHLGEA